MVRRRYPPKDCMREYICPICNKKFIVYVSQEWAYSIPPYRIQSRKLFCSWKCLREYERITAKATLDNYYKTKIKENKNEQNTD